MRLSQDTHFGGHSLPRLKGSTMHAPVRSLVIDRNPPEKSDPWKSIIRRLLPLWGHRNWIVIADAAYPAQSNPGIETIAAGADHLLVLQTTLDAVQGSKHVRANIYLDAELNAVSE